MCFDKEDRTQENPLTSSKYDCEKLAATCEFADVYKELVSQIIEGTSSSQLRRSSLRESDITLTQLLAIGRSLEVAVRQAATMERSRRDGAEAYRQEAEF